MGSFESGESGRQIFGIAEAEAVVCEPLVNEILVVIRE